MSKVQLYIDLAGESGTPWGIFPLCRDDDSESSHISDCWCWYATEEAALNQAKTLVADKYSGYDRFFIMKAIGEVCPAPPAPTTEYVRYKEC